MGSGGGEVGSPRLARLLLRLVVPADRREFIEGDLEERFARRVAAGERRGRALRWYWLNAVLSLRAGRGRQGWSGGRAHEALGLRGRMGRAADQVVHDVRVAIRALVRRPGFTAVAVITLGLGMGANTAVFSMVNHVLLRPLPGVRDADRLVVVEFVSAAGGERRTGISPPNLADLGAEVRTLDGLAAETIVPLQVWSGDRPPLATLGMAVSGDYFGVLGVRPVAGRLLRAAETLPGSGAMTAVISESLWTGWFARDPSVIGRELRVNRQSLTIVGVAGGGFRGTELALSTDVWVPLAAASRLRHFDRERYADRAPSSFRKPVGRLRPGVSLAAAQEDLRRAFAALIAAWPVENERLEGYQPVVHADPGLDPMVRPGTRATMSLMLGTVALVLLIACANVANLLLFRGVDRRGETAVRRSLGATGPRLAALHLAEGSVLAVLGALAGVLVAFWLTRLFAGTALLRLPAIEGLVMDARVLAFTLVAAVVTPLFFTAAPAALALRLDPAWHLREGARETGGRSRLRGGFAVVQVSLSLVLLVGALLLTRTLRNLMNVDIGFDAARVHAVMVDPNPQGYDRAASDAMARRLLDRLRETTGVQRVAAVTHAPFFSSLSTGAVRVAGADGERVPVQVNWVSDDYFATLGIPLLRGREPGPADQAAGSDGVVLSHALARQLFGAADPIGRTIAGGFRPDGMHTVIGVAGDVRTSDLADGAPLVVYMPLSQSYRSEADILLRSSLPPRQLDMVVRDALAAIDPGIPVASPVRLADAVVASENQRRILLRLVGVVALLAMTLATVGLYGLVAHSVAQRTREIGVRVALGARPRRIMRMVLGEAGAVAAIGILLGSGGAVAFARVLENRLFGVSSLDPLTYALAAAAFLAVTLAATFLPARTAVRVDPAAALRGK